MNLCMCGSVTDTMIQKDRGNILGSNYFICMCGYVNAVFSVHINWQDWCIIVFVNEVEILKSMADH